VPRDSGCTHATYFAFAFEALAPIVVTIGVEVKILHSESWVVVIDDDVRISIAIAKGLCMHADVCQLCRDILNSARRLLRCQLKSQQSHESRGLVLALLEQFSGEGGALLLQGTGLRRRHAKASVTYLFRMIKLLSSSSSSPCILDSTSTYRCSASTATSFETSAPPLWEGETNGKDDKKRKGGLPFLKI
jgi:hypothetical protein